ncbi:MAG: DUF1343 domain-containing protein [Clostridia bacterium]|nr:DUF1343 domain-containing protein [Clostridia bacterium]
MLYAGVDRLEKHWSQMRGKRVGLITGPTGLDARFCSTVDLLHGQGCLHALFSPEHGVRGDLEAGAGVDAYRDPATGVPVHSLYRADSKRLTPQMLADVDLLVFDLQDVGARYYTYLYTLLYALEDAAQAGVPLWVLDRPNPLGGLEVEGSVLRPGFESFVGGYDLAMRYGLTVGEFAEMANAERGLGAALTVVRLQGWRRGIAFTDWGLPWVPPSPNIATFDAALCYPGACLFEGTRLSEGRGTTAPFQLIGAPYIDAEELARAMNGLALPGVHFLPAHFTPAASKHSGAACHGVRLLVTDRRAFRPVAAGVHLLCHIRDAYSRDFEYLPPHRPGGRAMLELLSGSEVLRCTANPRDILEVYAAESEAFARRKRAYHLYD